MKTRAELRKAMLKKISAAPNWPVSQVTYPERFPGESEFEDRLQKAMGTSGRFVVRSRPKKKRAGRRASR